MNLFQAIRNDDLDALRTLLQESPDFDQTEPGGAETPLTLAVSLGKVEALKMLLAAGADANYVFPDLGLKLTILQAAASKPNPELARALIEAGAELNAQNVVGATALIDALHQGHVDVVRALLDAGADPNCGAHGPEQSSALVDAVALGYGELAARLIECGADVNRPNAEGAAPLMFAIIADAEWRDAAPSPESDRQRREMIDQLLTGGADPNCQLVRQVWQMDGNRLTEGMTPLMLAAWKGELPIVHRLLQAGADVSLADQNQHTAVDWAAKGGHPQVVGALKEAGGDTSVNDAKLNLTSLMTAAKQGNVRQLKKALAMGIDPNAVDPDRTQLGLCALLHAVEHQHEQAVRVLLEAGADPNQHQQAGDGGTALHVASELGNAGIVEMLLRAGADPNCANHEHVTPLALAARSRHARVVELLLEAVAAPLVDDQEAAMQPLCEALAAGSAEIANLLLDSGHPIDGRVLVAAANHGQTEIVRRALDAGVSPNCRGMYGDDEEHATYSEELDRSLYDPHQDEALETAGRTPLIAAAEIRSFIVETNPQCVDQQDDDEDDCGFDWDFEEYDEAAWIARAEQAQVETIKLLLDAGADPNGRDDHLRTPLIALAGLHTAINVLIESDEVDADGEMEEYLLEKVNPIPAMKLLLEAGADINAADRLGLAALHKIVAKEPYSNQAPLPIVEFLLQAGANVNGADAEGQTPLMFAVTERDVEVVRVLLDAGANVDAQDHEGKTALIHAANGGVSAEVLTLLLSRGADVNAKTDSGKTALSACQWYQNRGQYLRLLRKAGAQDPHRNEWRLMRAIRAKRYERVEKLIEQGVDVNHVYWHGTPLSLALEQRDDRLVQLLLQAGADVTLTSEDEYSIPPIFLSLPLAAGADSDELVKQFIQRGADPNCRDSVNRSLLLFAAQLGKRKIVDAVLEAGASVDDMEQTFLAPYRWEIAGQSSEFKRCIAELESLTGLSAQPYDFDKGRGAMTVLVSAEQEAQALRDADPELHEFTAQWQAYADKLGGILDALQTPFLQRGFYLVKISGYATLGRGRALALVPTNDPFAIMAWMGVNGNDVELRTEQIISWFRQMQRDHPFRLTACYTDTVDVTFPAPIADPHKLAGAMARFCPDMVSQGTGNRSALAEQLANTQKAHFWWD